MSHVKIILTDTARYTLASTLHPITQFVPDPNWTTQEYTDAYAAWAANNTIELGIRDAYQGPEFANGYVSTEAGFLGVTDESVTPNVDYLFPASAIVRVVVE